MWCSMHRWPGGSFFEQVLRDNLDIGRPDQISLVFGMTYDLRRLREHGLIQRIPKTRRYQVCAV
jgi:hypothetical protein